MAIYYQLSSEFLRDIKNTIHDAKRRELIIQLAIHKRMSKIAEILNDFLVCIEEEHKFLFEKKYSSISLEQQVRKLLSYNFKQIDYHISKFSLTDDYVTHISSDTNIKLYMSELQIMACVTFIFF